MSAATASRGFRISPDGGPPFRSKAFTLAESRIKARLEEQFGLILVPGEAGVGKTTLLKTLAEQFSGIASCVYLHRCPESFLELLHISSGQVKGPPDDTGAEARVIAVVDEGDRLSEGVIRSIYDTTRGEGAVRFQLIVACLPGSVGRITKMEFVHDLGVATCPLDGIETSEVRCFIEHRLRACGEAPGLFRQEALDEMALHARGVARRINLLCGKALFLAGVTSAADVTAALINEAALDLGLIESLPLPVEPPFPQIEPLLPEPMPPSVESNVSLLPMRAITAYAGYQDAHPRLRRAAAAKWIGAVAAVLLAAASLDFEWRTRVEPRADGQSDLLAAIVPLALPVPPLPDETTSKLEARSDIQSPYETPADGGRVPARYAAALYARYRELNAAGDLRGARIMLGLAAEAGNLAAKRRLVGPNADMLHTMKQNKPVSSFEGN